jgi:hypothetical protein
MPTGQRIDQIWAFVSEDANGGEGVCAFAQVDGIMMPMICADQARVDSLRAMAAEIKKASGLRIKLVKFSKRSFIEEV